MPDPSSVLVEKDVRLECVEEFKFDVCIAGEELGVEDMLDNLEEDETLDKRDLVVIVDV